MINNILAILCLGLLLVSCRKDIDFTEEELTSTSGPNNPNLEILKPWEEVVKPNQFVSLKYIESNGQDMLFVGKNNSQGWQICKLDSSGSISPLFSNLLEPSVLTYQAPLFYSAFLGGIYDNVVGFNTSGIQYSLDVALGVGKYINKIVKDADTLHLLGNFGSAGANAIPNGSNACSVNTLSGTPLAEKSIINGRIWDAQLINGQLCVSGEGLGSTNYPRSAMARWNGTSWSNFNSFNVQNSSSVRAIAYSFAHLENNDIIVSGRLKNGYSSVAYSQISGTTNGIFPEFIGTSDWLSNKVMVKRSNGYILAYNQVKFYNSSFTSVYVYNGSWRSIGALEQEAKDVVVHQGYVYAITGTGIKRHRIE